MTRYYDENRVVVRREGGLEENISKVIHLGKVVRREGGLEVCAVPAAVATGVVRREGGPEGDVPLLPV